MKKAAFVIILLCFVKWASAQEQLTKRQLADRLFERYEYYKSLQLYLDLTKKDKPDVNVIERVAKCYRLMNDDEHAEQWYSTALNYTTADVTDIYFYAEELLRNQKLEEAREQYKRYYSKVNAPDELKFKLAACDSAEQWMRNPANYTIKNQQQLNTPYSDWGLTDYGKEEFVFASDRTVNNGQQKSTDNRTGNSYLRLYLVNGDSILPLALNTKGNPIFNGDYHARQSF